MGFFYGVFIAFGVFLVIACSRSLTTFIHELGHTIPALLFSNGPVRLIVGSYGDQDSYKLNFGRLELWFKYNPFGWYSGLCQHQGVEGLGKNLIVIVGGPLASLLLGLGLLIFVVSGDFSDGQIFLFSIFILSGFWDFCVNMYPSAQPIPTQSGGLAYCDGRMLLNLVQLSGHGNFLEQAAEVEQKGDKEALYVFYDNYLQKNPSRIIAISLVKKLIEDQRYQDALDAFSIHVRPLKRTNSDFRILADIYHSLKNNHEALRCIEQYLYISFQDLDAINKRGEINLDLDNLDDAYNDFQSVLSFENNILAARVNYAYVLTKKEEYEAAAPLIEDTIGLLEDSPRQQFYAGFYYMKTNQNEKSLKHFNRAKELNWDHHGLNYFINEVDGDATS